MTGARVERPLAREAATRTSPLERPQSVLSSYWRKPANVCAGRCEPLRPASVPNRAVFWVGLPAKMAGHGGLAPSPAASRALTRASQGQVLLLASVHRVPKSKPSSAASHATAKSPKSAGSGCDSALNPERVKGPDLRPHGDRGGDQATPNRSALDGGRGQGPGSGLATCAAAGTCPLRL